MAVGGGSWAVGWPSDVPLRPPSCRQSQPWEGPRRPAGRPGVCGRCGLAAATACPPLPDPPARVAAAIQELLPATPAGQIHHAVCPARRCSRGLLRKQEEKYVLNFLIFDLAGGLWTLKPKGKVRKSLSSLAEGKPVLSYKRRPVLVGNIKSNLRCMEHDVCNIDNYESPPPPCVTYFQQAPSLGTTRWPKGRPVQAYERGQIIQKW